MTAVTVIENGVSVDAVVRVISGTLNQPVEVLLSTLSGTSTGAQVHDLISLICIFMSNSLSTIILLQVQEWVLWQPNDIVVISRLQIG